ncbi:unnamed protein product [Auanema sp. JU1783]|nr:unnamed protein product [Auanema sp. JU1783]
MTNLKSSLSQYDQLIGGLSSGLVSTAVCHPLDLLKTRFSANDGTSLRPTYRSYWHATHCIVKASGFRGMYQGFTPNMVGATLSWGLYFHWYHKIRDLFPAASNYQNTINFSSGMISGTCVMLFTNPIWVTKTRLFLQYENVNTTKRYKGMVDCLFKIAREEGIRGLYRGFLIGVIGTTHGALQFMIYNFMKDEICKSKGMVQDSQLSNFETTYCSIVSKVIATTAIFPYQVLRTRVQDHNVNNVNVLQTSKNIIGKEGLKGFYKGCLMANIRLLPAAVVTFLTYENVRHYVKSKP